MQVYYTKTVGIKQEPCTARGEDISLLAGRFNEAYRFFTDTLGVEHQEAERQALSVALKSLGQEDVAARPKPSMFAACGLETARMFRERTARWCAYVRGALRAARQSVVRILRCVRPVLRVFTASSAEAASRHRESDDAGGDDPDDDLSDVHPCARGFIRGVRKAARFKFSPVEMFIRDAARQTLPEWRASR